MSWGPFSAEAIALDSELRKLRGDPNTNKAIQRIEAALEHAHLHGPSNMTYAEFEAACDKETSQ